MVKKTQKGWPETLKEIVKALADTSLDLRAGIHEIAGHLLEVELSRTKLESVRMNAITAWVRELREGDLLSSEHATALVQQWLIETRAEAANRASNIASMLSSAPAVLQAILPILMSSQGWLKDVFNTERN